MVQTETFSYQDKIAQQHSLDASGNTGLNFQGHDGTGSRVDLNDGGNNRISLLGRTDFSNLPALWLFGDDGDNSDVNLNVFDNGNGDFGYLQLLGPGDQSKVEISGEDGSLTLRGDAGQRSRVYARER